MHAILNEQRRLQGGGHLREDRLSQEETANAFVPAGGLPGHAQPRRVGSFGLDWLTMCSTVDGLLQRMRAGEVGCDALQA